MGEIANYDVNAQNPAMLLSPLDGQQGRWYALQTVSRHEKKVGLQLGLDGLDVFVPTFSKESKWSDRRKLVTLPIFPGYVFLRSKDIYADRAYIFRNHSIVRLLSSGAGPAEIPAEEVENVRRITKTSTKFSPVPFLNVGQKVRIGNGALRGLEGILVRVAGEDSLIISVELIRRSISIRIQGYEIEPA